MPRKIILIILPLPFHHPHCLPFPFPRWMEISMSITKINKQNNHLPLPFPLSRHPNLNLFPLLHRPLTPQPPLLPFPIPIPTLSVLLPIISSPPFFFPLSSPGLPLISTVVLDYPIWVIRVSLILYCRRWFTLRRWRIIWWKENMGEDVKLRREWSW